MNLFSDSRPVRKGDSLVSVFSLGTLALVFGVLAASADSHAATVPRYSGGNAANFCQSALPVFDVQIRKRPLAVQNEGSSAAFVTCAFNAHATMERVAVSFNSRTGSPFVLNCTGILGIDNGIAQYAVKGTLLSGDGTQGTIQWLATDFPGNTSLLGDFGISCNLPPGMGINNTEVYYQEEIGA